MSTRTNGEWQVATARVKMPDETMAKGSVCLMPYGFEKGRVVLTIDGPRWGEHARAVIDPLDLLHIAIKAMRKQQS